VAPLEQCDQVHASFGDPVVIVDQPAPGRAILAVGGISL
jgi:hypothetical protein